MRVSIVIPAYNGEKWIRAAVESALAQVFIANDGYPELYEVIVCDDGSTDETVPTISDIIDKRLRIECHDHAGLVRSFQRALDHATTQYVTVLGQDDLIDPDYLATVMREFEGRDVAMVSCRPRFIGEDFKPYVNANDARLKVAFPENGKREDIRARLNFGNYYFGINTYVRQAIIDAGGLDEKAGWLLDWDLYSRILKADEIYIVERELCSMMLRAESTSLISRENLPQQHAYFRYVREKNFRPDPKQMKVVLATPFYMQQENSNYGTSMIYTCRMLTEAGIPWELIRVEGDSYVDRAKNTIVANFLEGDGTDLIMIDSDESWQPTAISRLLQHTEDIVAGAYPFKNRWGQFAGNPLVEVKEGKLQYSGYRELSDGSCLLEAYSIAGGFLRVKRAAFERFADFYPNDIYQDDYAWPDRAGRIYTAFFECGIHEFFRYGEDSNFSRKMRDAGIKIWIDPNITIRHHGMHSWEGNLHQHLLRPPEEREELRKQLETDEKIRATLVKAQAEVQVPA